MLVLSRKANQSIMIGDDIRILVVGVDRDQVKLGIEAPRHVPVHRFEIFAEIHRSEGSPATGPKLEAVGKTASQADIEAEVKRN
ncbi:MAG: carbon storage regulator CsrA [Candidatus Eremiobacteraeota bacterium]|nr:carbon storage regulator CsrA [Candidatus Eremiobacteraeota bacterium]